MDGARFDALARTWASRSSRRRLLAGIVGVGGAFGLIRAGDAGSCRRIGVPCRSGTDCCTESCQDDRCACPPGEESCVARGQGIICVPACPQGQYLARGCRCVCAATGEPPGPEFCPCGCAAGEVCTAEGCRDLAGGCTKTSTCGPELEFCDAFFCACDTTTDGPLVCSDFGGFDCSLSCETTADCAPGFACVTTACCDPPACVPVCGNGGFFPAEISPRHTSA